MKLKKEKTKKEKTMNLRIPRKTINGIETGKVKSCIFTLKNTDWQVHQTFMLLTTKL